ncbi:MAG TPA: tail fiber domain-containing protein, partial [Vicinamibacterales bacterium]|nr:tail fiber domain-containing protein [Vicinamibacterales bacterium]
ALLRLRPVTFKYRAGVDDGQRLKQYGLVAEEVAAVNPDWVVRGADGRIDTVRYHFLTPVLVNEVQRQQRTIDAQREQLTEQAARIERLEQEKDARIAGLEIELQRIKAALGL